MNWFRIAETLTGPSSSIIPSVTENSTARRKVISELRSFCWCRQNFWLQTQSSIKCKIYQLWLSIKKINRYFAVCYWIFRGETLTILQNLAEILWRVILFFNRVGSRGIYVEHREGVSLCTAYTVWCKYFISLVGQILPRVGIMTVFCHQQDNNLISHHNHTTSGEILQQTSVQGQFNQVVTFIITLRLTGVRL